MSDAEIRKALTNLAPIRDLDRLRWLRSLSVDNPVRMVGVHPEDTDRLVVMDHAIAALHYKTTEPQDH